MTDQNREYIRESRDDSGSDIYRVINQILFVVLLLAIVLHAGMSLDIFRNITMIGDSILIPGAANFYFVESPESIPTQPIYYFAYAAATSLVVLGVMLRVDYFCRRLNYTYRKRTQINIVSKFALIMLLVGLMFALKPFLDQFHWSNYERMSGC